MRTHNIPSCYRKSKRSLLSLLTWRYYQLSLAQTTLVSNQFSWSQRCLSHWSSTVLCLGVFLFLSDEALGNTLYWYSNLTCPPSSLSHPFFWWQNGSKFESDIIPSLPEIANFSKKYFILSKVFSVEGGMILQQFFPLKGRSSTRQSSWITSL